MGGSQARLRCCRRWWGDGASDMKPRAVLGMRRAVLGMWRAVLGMWRAVLGMWRAVGEGLRHSVPGDGDQHVLLASAVQCSAPQWPGARPSCAYMHLSTCTVRYAMPSSFTPLLPSIGHTYPQQNAPQHVGGTPPPRAHLAATSVATSTLNLPSLKRCSECSRCAWAMSPCSASQGCTCVTEAATSSAPAFVRENTMALPPAGRQPQQRQGLEWGQVRAARQGGAAAVRALVHSFVIASAAFEQQYPQA